VGGEDRETVRGLEKVNWRNTASGWKVIQGGGEEEATHTQQIRLIRNTFPSTLRLAQFGFKVTKVTQQFCKKATPKLSSSFNPSFFPQNNVQHRPATLTSASPDFLQARSITLFQSVFPHCLLAAISIWSGHSSIVFSAFSFFLYSFFKAFVYWYLRISLLFCWLLYVHSSARPS